MLLPATVTARRADSTVVIGTALLASARGSGYRRIAAQLDRPTSTVRRWVRAVRDPGHVEWLRAQGVGWPAQIDRDLLGDVLARRRPSAGPLDEALTTLAAAAIALRTQIAPRVPPSALIAQMTRGRLVAGPAPVAPD